ncbi:MAG: cytochrome c [Magnetospirillum sp.]|nr:cytochrome c [Magnetospirillum sp.]
MRFILALVLVVVLIAAGLGAAVYTGRVDVSARQGGGPVAEWLAAMVVRQSVRTAAKGIQPPSLTDGLMIEEGARRFAADCAPCHGAPGVRSLPFARAMRPEPADLATSAAAWTPAELFWIIRDGLKFSGMPSWQSSYAEGDIWALVAFIGQLPQMDADGYRALTAEDKPGELEGAPPPEQEMIPPSEGDEGPAPPTPPEEGPAAPRP